VVHVIEDLPSKCEALSSSSGAIPHKMAGTWKLCKFLIKISTEAGHQWLTPIILATRKQRAERLTVEVSPHK
jgi:hypothetical protein